MTNLYRISIAAAFLLVMCSVQLATAAEAPADLCSLLPVDVVSKTLGQGYDPPVKTAAPRLFPKTNGGTDCTYQSKSGNLLFRAYVDPSPAAAVDLFARVRNIWGRGSTTVVGLGDDAYFDVNGGLYVHKGKIRFSVFGATDKQSRDLASGVIARSTEYQ